MITISIVVVQVIRLVNISKPVSYTHLDVYKRQIEQVCFQTRYLK